MSGEVVPAEVVNDDAPAVQHGADIANYQPVMALTPQQASEQADRMREIQAAVMKEGVDYGVIPGTDKPSLLKSGAEWLLKCFGFGHEFDDPILEREDGRFVGATYRARVTKMLPDGKVVTVATCDGYAGYDEDRFWDKPRYCSCPWGEERGKKNHQSGCERDDPSQYKRKPRNTVIKMAQKRALVGATLQATGTSGLFTQDVEEYAGGQQDAPAEQGPGPQQQGGGGKSEEFATDNQVKRLHALRHKMPQEDGEWVQAATDLVISDTELSKIIYGRTGADSAKQLSKKAISDLMDALSDEETRRKAVQWARRKLAEESPHEGVGETQRRPHAGDARTDDEERVAQRGDDADNDAAEQEAEGSAPTEEDVPF